MIITPVLEKWLHAANTRYRNDGTEHRQRPFRAIRDFSIDHNCSFDLSSPTATTIFEWFKQHSPEDAHAVGSMFTGAFLFDTSFWPLHIPIIFGTVVIDPLGCLETMPPVLKKQIENSSNDIFGLVNYWVDCIDYAYGIDHISQQDILKPRAKDFVLSAGREMIGAIAQLTIPRPNTKAILSIRMATEIFLKAILIQELDLNDVALKKINHSVKSAAEECAKLTDDSTFTFIANNANIFPAVAERYDGIEWPREQVWKGLVIAQMAAAALTRNYGGQDTRPQISTGY
jgi:hypothetical protein